MGLTEAIAAFITRTDFESIPKEARDLSKRTFLDTLGVILAGSREPVSGILQEYLTEMGGNPVAAMIGTTVRAPSPWAALANGTLAHAIDYDDSTGSPLPLHPSVSVMPVVLALGEQLRLPGRKLIEAYIIGLEIETKIASTIGLAPMKKGWHATGIVGTLGATAAAVKLLQLPPEQIRTAFGLAASLASGLRLNFGTMAKPFHAGRSAYNGVTSAVLAGKGFTANPNILEETDGYFDVFGSGNYDLDGLTESLGNPFYLLSPSLDIKKYASCRGTHQAIDGILKLVNEYHFSYQDVAEIKCGVHPLTAVDNDNPTTPLEGKFSVQYCMATALLEGKVGLEQFTDEKINRPEVRRIMARTKVYLHPDMDESQLVSSVVTVRLRNEQEHTLWVDKERGNLKTMGWDEHKTKFVSCASLALPTVKIDSLIKIVVSLEEIESLKGLVELTT